MGMHNFPPELTPFVGRARELAELEAVWRSTRLLTLTGPGGAGKTRLCRELCERSAAGDGKDVWFVDLAPVGDPALLPRTVATTLALDVDPSDATTSLVDVLRDTGGVIVLDNCEHILEASRSLTAMLLNGCPDVRIMATSREAIGLGAETVWLVPPMQNAADVSDIDALMDFDAVRLFVDRARATNRAFELSPSNAGGVLRVIDSLDGIPLALELAAAWSRSLTPDEIAARLDQRLRLLTRGLAEAPARHRSLRAAIDWSYELLNNRDRRTFEQLSVFRGGFGLEAAEALCVDDDVQPIDVVEALGELVESSLVAADTSRELTRYTLLETIREYGAEQLAASGREAVTRARHVSWARQLADRADAELHRSDQVLWIGVLETEHDNIREALGWCLEQDAGTGLELAAAMGQFWRIRAHLVEGRDCLERFLEAAHSSGDVIRGKAFNSLGMLAGALSDLEAARSAYNSACDHMRSADDPRGVATALANLGIVAVSTAEWHEARTRLEEASAIFDEIGDRSKDGRMRLNLGAVLVELGDTGEARTTLESAMDLLRETDDKRGIASCAGELGNLMARDEDWAGATSWYEQALATFRELGARDAEAGAFRSLASVAMQRGDPAGARAFLKDALELYEAVGRRADAAVVLLHIGRIDLARGAFEQAVSQLTGALAHADAAPRFVGVEALEAMAAIAHEQGDDTLAASLLGSASIVRDVEGVEPSEERAATLAASTAEALASRMTAEGFARERSRGRTATLSEAIDAAIAFARTMSESEGAIDDDLRMVREGDVWTIAFEGRTVRMQDSKGIQHLAALIEARGAELHVLDLVTGRPTGTHGTDHVEPSLVAGRGADAGEMLDATARDAYRRRITELEDDLDEAVSFNDEGRATHVRAELDAVMDELRRATGLGGRVRKAASETERARLNVQRTIKAAIRRVFESDRVLGRHLDAAVKTGTYCSYNP
jgi:non-specific serine/threonine protein kinase